MVELNIFNTAPIVFGSFAFLLMLFGLREHEKVLFYSLVFSSISITVLSTGHIKEGVIILCIEKVLLFLYVVYRSFRNV